MTLTELKYIVAVARERHFGKAAEACFVRGWVLRNNLRCQCVSRATATMYLSSVRVICLEGLAVRRSGLQVF